VFRKVTVPATVPGHEVGIDCLVVHSVGPLGRRGKDTLLLNFVIYVGPS